MDYVKKYDHGVLVIIFRDDPSSVLPMKIRGRLHPPSYINPDNL